MTTQHLVRRDLRAMNSDIELVCCRPDSSHRLDRAASWLAAYEARFSRFRLLSELSRLNRSAGRPFRASPALFELVQLSLELAQRSNGLFDPTVLSALETAGYDRSFELLTNRDNQRGLSRVERPQQENRTSWIDVGLDPTTRAITLPPGTGIDLGGIGKGWAVDRLAAILGTPCLVNGGGDVSLRGHPPNEPAWRAGIADPFQPERDLCVLALTDRAVATSSTLKRRWQYNDTVLHHLIDPRTGHPSTSDAVQVTVVAPTAVLADYHAKVTLLLGPNAGLEYLQREPDVAGLIVTKDGVALDAGIGSSVITS
jgi:thiamine biosynthesis lipoprotein